MRTSKKILGIKWYYDPKITFISCEPPPPQGGTVHPIMAYMGRLRPNGVPFSGFRYIKG